SAWLPRSQYLWQYLPCWLQRWAASVAALANPRVEVAVMTPREPAAEMARTPAVLAREPAPRAAPQPPVGPAPQIAPCRGTCPSPPRPPHVAEPRHSSP